MRRLGGEGGGAFSVNLNYGEGGDGGMVGNGEGKGDKSGRAQTLEGYF